MRTLVMVCLLAACNSPTQATSDPATAASSAVEAKPASTPAAPEKNPEKEAAPKEQASTAQVGKPAPEFSLTSLSGETHTLSQYAGKTVVLEWFNPDCPFVRAAHTTGNLKDTAPYRKGDVVWLAINSNGPGKQGHGKDANEAGKKRFGIDYPILLDPAGDVGRAYGAERTPHMYVIDPKGTLVYAGALDDTRSGDLEDGDGQNYLQAALTAVGEGKPVDPASTKAWGCSVKYTR